jgi:hypothetical protein
MAFLDFLHFFTDLFSSAERTWHKLEPEAQKALVFGSGVIKEITDNIERTPDEVFDIISNKYPDLTKEKLEDGLEQVSAYLKLPVDPDLTKTIQNLQQYFSTQKGKFWDGVRSTLAQVLSFSLAPQGTAWGLITSIMEWVFRKKVK